MNREATASGTGVSEGERPERIAVAVSGGGYRATAWGLGVLWCLADTGLNRDVTMVSSVSGGSILNAHVGLEAPYREVSPDEFAASATRLARRLAGSVWGWRCGLIATILVAAAGAVFVGIGEGVLVAVAAGALIVVAVGASIASRDMLFGRVETWLYVDVLLAGTWLMVWAWPRPLLVVGGVVLLAVVALLRGPVVGWSIGRSLHSLSERSDQSLSALNDEPLHVFLATELRAGHHACFARSFVYCYDLGLGAEPSLPVRVAVQASANLPGAFPTRWVRAAGAGFRGGEHRVAWMALSDGGVYDNMADQWPLGLRRRIARLSAHGDIVDHAPALAVLRDWEAREPNFVIVANASGALGYRKVGRGALPLIGEMLGLLQVKDVLYDNGNSVRRTRLIDSFDAGTPNGTLVHITTNPTKLPALHTAHSGTTATRANEALAYLSAHGGSETDWKTRADRAAGAGTQLWPLGSKLTAEIILAAYAQTMANLHVKCGTSLHEPPRFDAR